jgi:hypothetical protein
MKGMIEQKFPSIAFPDTILNSHNKRHPTLPRTRAPSSSSPSHREVTVVLSILEGIPQRPSVQRSLSL